MSKGNWRPKENYPSTKEHKLESTRPFCLTFGNSILQVESQQLDY